MENTINSYDKFDEYHTNIANQGTLWTPGANRGIPKKALKITHLLAILSRLQSKQPPSKWSNSIGAPRTSPWIGMSWPKLRRAYPWISYLCWGNTRWKDQGQEGGWRKQEQDYITKEDVSSPTVSAELAMLICMINTLEDQDIAVINFPNAFVQTVIEDEEHHVVVHIRGPLGDILVSIAPDVYDPYMSTNKAGKKVPLKRKKFYWRIILLWSNIYYH
jgi:hypothetical protein